eukprot:Awhi_evm1s9804
MQPNKKTKSLLQLKEQSEKNGEGAQIPLAASPNPPLDLGPSCRFPKKSWASCRSQKSWFLLRSLESWNFKSDNFEKKLSSTQKKNL